MSIKKSVIIMSVFISAFLSMAQTAMAEDNRHEMNAPMHGDMQSDTAMQSNMPAMFLVKKEIDGYTLTFHAMQAKKGMQHGGTHNLMVKVEEAGKALTDLKVNSKVTYPDKTSESKMLMKMGDWYMAGYDLGQTGQYQLMVLFKTADGHKHFGGVYYPEETVAHKEDHHEQHHH